MHIHVCLCVGMFLCACVRTLTSQGLMKFQSINLRFIQQHLPNTEDHTLSDHRTIQTLRLQGITHAQSINHTEW